MLEIDGITAGYGDLTILKGITAAVEKGEIVAVLGSNGAGKSTMLRVISGFIKPSEGKILLRNEEITCLPSHKVVLKGIVQVPEARQLFAQMTVKDNLTLGSYSPVARPKKNQNLEKIFHLFPVLKRRKGQLAGFLSGGEQQMVAIGRALMACPQLLMLDEPSLGLAPIIVEQIFQIVSDIRKDGVSILIVEQNIYETIELCDRGYVLENGEIVLNGTSQQLLSNEKVKEAYLGV